MRAIRVKVIGPEKRVQPTRNAYRPGKNNAKQFCCSEFYYPGELSDAKMLQLHVPTHSEATNRKSLLSKRSNAAARSLIPPKNENEK